MAEKKGKKGNGILFGLILLGGALGAIWKNEHRFDYYKAARDTSPIESRDQLVSGRLFSYSGEMQQDLLLVGRYVESFTGYLEVRRRAEIYAWDRDEDDDGVTWSKRWMSSLEHNERNRGLTKELESGTIAPDEYRISDLPIQAAKVQFVDPPKNIPPSGLKLAPEGTGYQLVARGESFHLDKGGSEKLGDERITYEGVPVPETATYFGKWGGELAVAHQAEVKEGIIAGIIQDEGILHHLVAGPRDAALATMKAHLARLKMIFRVVGLIVATIGGGILFASLTRLLIFIPVIGPLLHRVTGWVGMLAGFLLGLLTLCIAFLTSKPILLAGVALAFVVGLFLLIRNATRKRTRIQQNITTTLGHPPTTNELAELEFVKLRQLAASNGGISPAEQKVLDRWTRRNGWSAEKIDTLTRHADQDPDRTSDREKLETLIRYSLADGRVDRAELKTLQAAADWVGIGRKGLGNLLAQAQRE
jgi:hypothetical protein